MDLQLHDKVALVTGGSKGIGLGIVRELITEGAKVANVNRSEAEGRQLEQEYAAEGKGCFFIQGDLTDLAACKNAVEQTIQKFGRIDILINNAGINDGVGLEDGPDAFLLSLQRNLIHYYALVHYALDELKKSQGTIINIGSKVCETGQGGTSGYAASKGAINGLTREWAVDLAPHKVRVNTVLPAETWTPLYERCLAEMPDPEQAKAEIERLIPLGQRFTTIEELAGMVVFLASPRSSHTTGQIVFVDGGYTHLDRKCTFPSDVTGFGGAST
ncbi:MAG: SDR family oxidoreductase [Planctomycetaceae bacterium]|jgi:L-fucose dehydrogenase|nr:SDR family oxidoreductase [bacterium]MDC0274328.1 SDR family oxidoreductase [Planctomycetaceae bacterium]MDC0308451.1 SDR family oxidoreductase [Planctomycetaceae bacterium]MDG2388555.1 SDR family oxidoreductase [Planctomycetaceae bacterium]